MQESQIVASTRLARDRHGRLCAIVTTADSPVLELGARFLVLGNDFPVNERGVQWLGARTGEPAPRYVPRPHAALAAECFEAAGGNGLTALRSRRCPY